MSEGPRLTLPRSSSLQERNAAQVLTAKLELYRSNAEERKALEQRILRERRKKSQDIISRNIQRAASLTRERKLEGLAERAASRSARRWSSEGSSNSDRGEQLEELNAPPSFQRPPGLRQDVWVLRLWLTIIALASRSHFFEQCFIDQKMQTAVSIIQRNRHYALYRYFGLFKTGLPDFSTEQNLVESLFLELALDERPQCAVETSIEGKGVFALLSDGGKRGRNFEDLLKRDLDPPDLQTVLAGSLLPAPEFAF
eukprot:tig00021464_g21762.t1